MIKQAFYKIFEENWMKNKEVIAKKNFDNQKNLILY